jgi:hypothetical protein
MEASMQLRAFKSKKRPVFNLFLMVSFSEPVMKIIGVSGDFSLIWGDEAKPSMLDILKSVTTRSNAPFRKRFKPSSPLPAVAT